MAELEFYKSDFEIVWSRTSSRRLDNIKQWLLVRALYENFPTPIETKALMKVLKLNSVSTLQNLLKQVRRFLGDTFPFEIMKKCDHGYMLVRRVNKIANGIK